jgi:leucyl-tRNA synthetase
MWKKIGKEGFAVKAPWPVVAGEEDKLLTRQAKFLRDGLKRFRGQHGKAKKGCIKASIVVSDSYPAWKVDTLKWMQEQYSDETGFPDSFMKDLKGWIGKNVTDKKMIKFNMQFASFMKNEAAEVGKVALDIQSPFDQAAILDGSMRYMKSQLNLEELDILKSETAEGIPEKIVDQVTPGKPYLWMR